MVVLALILPAFLAAVDQVSVGADFATAATTSEVRPLPGHKRDVVHGGFHRSSTYSRSSLMLQFNPRDL